MYYLIRFVDGMWQADQYGYIDGEYVKERARREGLDWIAW